MAGFFYYVPGKSTTSAEDLRGVGLGYALRANTGVQVAGMSPGPDGGSGAIATMAHRAPAMGESGRARWINAGGYWVGIDPENPPTPEDLLHEELIDGHYVSLGDGNRWLIPVARRFDGGTALPRKITWSPDGWGLGDAVGVHAELWRGACLLFEALLRGENEVTIGEELDMISAALSVNYRLGPPELMLLELITTTNREEIVLALIDWEAFKEYAQKKTASVAEPSTPGSAA